MNPSFGTILRNLMFENINQGMVDRIKNTVRAGLSEYFPTVVPVDFRVEAEPDSNIVTLLLKYAIQNTNIEDEVVINFEQ